MTTIDHRVRATLKKKGIILEKQIGDGTEAVVYSAKRDIGNGMMADCAVKLYLSQTPTFDVKQLEQQIQILMQANKLSRYFVHFYQMIPDQLFVALVMELAEGSLEKLLKENTGGMSRDRVYSLLLTVAQGIAAAHDLPQPMYHGDLKPANLVLCSGHVKICDFGTAAIAQSQSTVFTKGHTAAYLLPGHEKKLTKERDIFALAVTYAQLRLGRRPFQNEYAIPDGKPYLNGLDDDEVAVLQPVLEGKFLRKPSPVKWFSGLAPISDLPNSNDRSRIEYALRIVERSKERRKNPNFVLSDRDIEDLTEAVANIDGLRSAEASFVAAQGDHELMMLYLASTKTSSLVSEDEAQHQQFNAELHCRAAVRKVECAFELQSDVPAFHRFRAELCLAEFRVKNGTSPIRQILLSDEATFDLPNYWSAEVAANPLSTEEMDSIRMAMEHLSIATELEPTTESLVQLAKVRFVDSLFDAEKSNASTTLENTSSDYLNRRAQIDRLLELALEHCPVESHIERANVHLLRAWMWAGLQIGNLTLPPQSQALALQEVLAAEVHVTQYRDLATDDNYGSRCKVSEHLENVIHRMRFEYSLAIGLNLGPKKISALGLSREKLLTVLDEALTASEFLTTNREQGILKVSFGDVIGNDPKLRFGFFFALVMLILSVFMPIAFCVEEFDWVVTPHDPKNSLGFAVVMFLFFFTLFVVPFGLVMDKFLTLRKASDLPSKGPDVAT